MNFLRKNTKQIAFTLIFGAFCGQYLILGVTYATDTVRFESFSSYVHPLYPVVLWFFRTLFGLEYGYFLLGLFQNILLAGSIYSLNNYLKNTLKINTPTYFLLLFVSSMVFFLQKWFTRAGIISSNTLFSEALSIPLYLFFFRYALQAIWERSKKAYLYACIFATGIILTRGQLYWVIVVVFVIRLYLAEHNRKQALLSAIVSCSIIVGCVQGARFIQTQHVQDTQERSPASIYVFTTAVYCSEYEDIYLFAEGSAERQLLGKIRTWMDDPTHLASFSQETGDFTNRQKKFEYVYDDLKADIVSHYNILRGEGHNVSINKVTARLVFANPGSFVLHCMQNALTGLIRTVAILKPGINLLVCLFYAFAVLCLMIVHKNQNLKKECQLAYLGFMCVLLNALIMAPGVFALSRYMFYNMPIIYLTAILFLRALIKDWRCKQ